MRDPMTWSFPMGRLFGIAIRVHVMLPLVLLGLILRVTSEKGGGVAVTDAVIVAAIMFGSILLHEFGHCFAARAVQGDASEVWLWPLGGLASCDLPDNPRAHLACALGGPAVNLTLCLFSAGALAFAGYSPPINPFDSQFTSHLTSWREGVVVWSKPAEASLTAKPRILANDSEKAELAGGNRPTVSQAPVAPPQPKSLELWHSLAAKLFWVNWLLFLINALPAFPLDGGRVLQSILWMNGDFRQAVTATSYVGFVVMLLIGVFAIVANDVLAFALALFVYLSCRHQLMALETGGEESPFGYDFSQGYAAFEDSPRTLRARQPNWFQRWMHRRAARRAVREIEERENEEIRMDQLLDKVQKNGLSSLTDEERRFLARISARYRGNRP